jgi:hypothetical protein
VTAGCESVDVERRVGWRVTGVSWLTSELRDVVMVEGNGLVIGCRPPQLAYRSNSQPKLKGEETPGHSRPSPTQPCRPLSERGWTDIIPAIAINYLSRPKLNLIHLHPIHPGTARPCIMAQKAKKDRAKSNAEALRTLHLGTLIINTLFVLANLFFRRRSLLLYAVLSAPAFVCEYVLERTGRPKYGPNGQLKAGGEDLNSAGLTEYMWDTVWITWASVIAVIFFGNGGWLIWGVVPVFALIKGWGLLSAARGMASGMNAPQAEDAQPQPGNRKQRRAA